MGKEIHFKGTVQENVLWRVDLSSDSLQFSKLEGITLKQLLLLYINAEQVLQKYKQYYPSPVVEIETI